MASSFSAFLRFELPANGEQAGIWNITFNRNLGDLAEQAITGATTLDMSGGDQQLNALNGALDSARSAVLMLTGYRGELTNVELPPSDKIYDVWNFTDADIKLALPNGIGFECPYNSVSYVSIHTGGTAISGRAFTAYATDVLSSEGSSALIESMGAAPINSPALEGSPTAPTAPDGDDSDLIANTEFVYKNGVPPGAITMWGLEAHKIPIGWVICDGKNNTPDLTGRFIVGAQSEGDIRSTGGYADATLVAHSHGGVTGGQSATHGHSGSTNSAGAHTHGGVMRVGAYGTNTRHTRDMVGTPGNTAAAGNHSHTFTTGAESTSHTHSITTVGVDPKGRNMPPYKLIIYIMKE